MADAEGELADADGVAVDQPAVGLERDAGNPEARAILAEALDPEPVVLVRALDRHAELLGEGAGEAAMVDMAVGEQDLLDCHPGLLGGGLELAEIAARIDERGAHRRGAPDQASNSAEAE